VTVASAGCKCGAIEIEISAPVEVAVNCHCAMCRSINGSAFSTYAPLASSAVHAVKGSGNLSSYQVTSGARKHWCQSCGTPLFNTNTKYPDRTMIYYGALREHATVVPRVNIYCSSRLPWVNSLQQLKSYDEARTTPA
jgi:hypothetical protein